MSKKLIGFSIVGAAIALGAAIGVKLASDPQFRGRFTRGAKDVLGASKKKVDAMSEDVAMRAAQLTKNPQINRDWVENQWESIGY